MLEQDDRGRPIRCGITSATYQTSSGIRWPSAPSSAPGIAPSTTIFVALAETHQGACDGAHLHGLLLGQIGDLHPGDVAFIVLLYHDRVR
ncbi:MAG: hypothetical protein R2789_09855 [Microthrixaceae bacterium]